MSGLPNEGRHHTLAWTVGRYTGPRPPLSEDDIWREVEYHAREWGFARLDFAYRAGVIEAFRGGAAEGHLDCDICGETNGTVKPRPTPDPWGYMHDRGSLCTECWTSIEHAMEEGDVR